MRGMPGTWQGLNTWGRTMYCRILESIYSSSSPACDEANRHGLLVISTSVKKLVRVPGTQSPSTIPGRGTLTTSPQHSGRKTLVPPALASVYVRTEAKMADLCETGPKYSFTARHHLYCGFYRLAGAVGLKSWSLQDVLGAYFCGLI